MPYVDAAGLAIHYERYGRGPIPVVLVHGNFASARWWTRFIHRLPSEYSAYAVDLRGCGESDHPKDGFGIPRLAHDIHLVIAGLELTTYHLIGHSLGAAVALQLALDHWEVTRTLSLLAPSPADGLEGLRKGTGEMARLINLYDPKHQPSMTLFSVMLQWGRATGIRRRRVAESLKNMMPTADLDAEDMERLVNDAEILTSDTVVGFYRALHRWDIRERLREVRVPTQIVGGDLDPIIPKGALTELAGHLPQAHLDIWDDIGHSPQLEDPGRLADHFDRFAYRYDWRLRWRRWSRWLRRGRRPPAALRQLSAGATPKALPSGKEQS